MTMHINPQHGNVILRSSSHEASHRRLIVLTLSCPSFSRVHVPPGEGSEIRRGELNLNFLAQLRKLSIVQVLGLGLKSLPRDQIYVTTKTGRYGDHFDFSAENVKSSVRESLKVLQLQYLDLVHCHDIEFVGLTQVQHP